MAPSVIICSDTFAYAYAASILINFILGPHERYYDLVLLSVMWAITVKAVDLENILLMKEKSEQFWNLLFLLFPAITWITYLPGAGNAKNYIGNLYLPVLITMFVLSIINLNIITNKTNSQGMIKVDD